MNAFVLISLVLAFVLTLLHVFFQPIFRFARTLALFLAAVFRRHRGIQTGFRYDDTVMVIAWNTGIPAGTKGRFCGEAINHATQQLEYRVLVGTRFKWVPAKAVAKLKGWD